MRFYEGPIEPEAIADARDARRFLLVLFMLASQLYFYVLGPSSLLGY